MARINWPGIPSIDRSLPFGLGRVLAPVREILNRMTSPDDPVAHMSDLVDAGLISQYENQTVTPLPSTDTTVPPAPTGLAAGGALANIILEWDATSYANLAYTEVWRAQSNSIGLAERVGSSPAGASVYVDEVNHTGTWYYWIRYISKANIAGPFNAQNGVSGSTGVDPATLLELLTGEQDSPYFNQFPFLIISSPTTINGVSVPAGVYILDAFIANGTISNAKIGNLAVDSAKIANLAVGTAKIADLAVTTGKIDSLAVTTAKIDSLAVTNAKIGALAVDSAKIADLAVTTAKIDDLSVSTLKIADQAVTFPYGLAGSSTSINNSSDTTILTTTSHTYSSTSTVTVIFTGIFRCDTVPSNETGTLKLFISTGAELKRAYVDFGIHSNYATVTSVWTGSVSPGGSLTFSLKASCALAAGATCEGTITLFETKK